MKNAENNILKGNPAKSGDVREFLDGSTRYNLLLRSCFVGLGAYNPGWKWSTHAGAQTGKPSANHIGYVLSGKMKIQDSTGVEVDVGPGDAFEVGAGADAWVIGDEACIALDFTPITPCS